MRAYFEEGSDIGELDELFAIGSEVGLSAAEARNALILRVGQDGVVAAERHAAVLGITGVPTYIFDGQYTISARRKWHFLPECSIRWPSSPPARGVAS